MKALYILIWVVYTVVIMAILPFYLISYPFNWLWSKIDNRGVNPWWWDLGDWIEERLPA